MDQKSDSGSSSAIESDFSDSGPDNDVAETVNDSFPNIEKADARFNEMTNSVEAGYRENDLSKASQASEQADSDSNTENIIVLEKLPAPRIVDDILLEPEVGMVFHSEDEAFEFYNAYAKRKGFSVRKGHVSRRKDGSLRVRIFLCSNEGLRQVHRTHVTRRPRTNERTNCKARIEFKVDRDNLWTVRKVNLEHNHPLASPKKSHMLRSHRKIWRSQLGVINEVDNLGEDHCIEFRMKRMRDLEKENAQLLLDFLKTKQSEDPSFFYAIQLDESGQLTNFFWTDGRSLSDYTYFGDVVSFDTTFRVSNFDIPFAPFLGVNHHNQTVIFAAALLLDESIESFLWLFRTFMVAMSGRQPRTIFTDHCDALSKAISMTFPETCHRFCLWHIYQNSLKYLSHVYNSEPNFQNEFKVCIYEDGSEEDLETGWNNLVNNYNLAGNSWIGGLYAARERWALVFHKDIFCASIITMQWSERMSHLFKKYFNRKLPFSKFMEQYPKVLIRFHEKELLEDYKSRQSKPVLLANVSILNEAAESYTRLVYSEFEEEFKNQFACLCEPVGVGRSPYTFKVSLPKQHSVGLVEFNPGNLLVSCSCKRFERTGILCMHALKVLNTNNILHFPSQYILKRWTKRAKSGVIPNRDQTLFDSDGQEPLTLCYRRVCHKATVGLTKSAVSRDALEFFEGGLDRLIRDLENYLDSSPHDVERVKRKGKAKGAHEKKSRKKTHATGNSANVGSRTDLSRSKGQSDDVSVRMLIDESPHVQPYQGEDVASYYNGIPMQTNSISGYTSFPPEAVIPTQETFTTSQGIFDQTIGSQGASAPDIGRSSDGGTVGVSMPVMQGQSNSFTWEVQGFNVPGMVVPQHHLDRPLHPDFRNQQQPSGQKLSLDINKGS